MSNNPYKEFPDTDTQRYCPICKGYLDKDDFYKNRRDGLTRRCRKHHIAKSYQSRQRYHGGNRYDYHRKTVLKKYGLTVDDYRVMFENQNGLCAICGFPETFKKNHGDSDEPRMMPVDHDHRTNKPRKLLCSNCNLGIGNFKENPNLLIIAAEYLKSFGL